MLPCSNCRSTTNTIHFRGQSYCDDCTRTILVPLYGQKRDQAIQDLAAADNALHELNRLLSPTHENFTPEHRCVCGARFDWETSLWAHISELGPKHNLATSKPIKPKKTPTISRSNTVTREDLI